MLAALKRPAPAAADMTQNRNKEAGNLEVELKSRELQLKAWEKHEEVAMHFNDLIMRWRLQAIGGLAGFVTLAGFVVGDAASPQVRYRAMLILTSVIAFAWVAVAAIDLFYYRRLLQGAVNAIIELERRSSLVNLSTRIEEFAASGSRWAPWVFYLGGLTPLLGIIGWAIYNLATLPPEVPLSL
jgi:hypothetical protein